MTLFVPKYRTFAVLVSIHLTFPQILSLCVSFVSSPRIQRPQVTFNYRISVDMFIDASIGKDQESFVESGSGSMIYQHRESKRMSGQISLPIPLGRREGKEGLFLVHRQESRVQRWARVSTLFRAELYFQSSGCQGRNRSLSVIELQPSSLMTSRRVHSWLESSNHNKSSFRFVDPRRQFARFYYHSSHFEIARNRIAAFESS